MIMSDIYTWPRVAASVLIWTSFLLCRFVLSRHGLMPTCVHAAYCSGKVHIVHAINIPRPLFVLTFKLLLIVLLNAILYRVMMI